MFCSNQRSAKRHETIFVAKQCRCTGLHENQEPTETGKPDRQKLRLGGGGGPCCVQTATDVIGRRNQVMNINRKPSEYVLQYALA